MRISKDNLSKVMRPFVKIKDGTLCIRRGKVDAVINALLDAYGNEGCAKVETNEYGQDFLIIYAADKNHLRKVQEYYVGKNKEISIKEHKVDKEDIAPDHQKGIAVDESAGVPKSECIKGDNFEIKRQIGVISESSKGWKKELNLISWHGKDAKYDIREWSPDHSRMGKGVTLTLEELKRLKLMLENVIL